MRTLKYLQKTFSECLEEVKALDIPVGHINGIRWGKLRKKWGICVWHKAADTFDIVISVECQRQIISVDDLKTIILHEILHTCGCINHDKLWVQYALKLDKAYGYSVSVFKTPFEFFHNDFPVLHTMVCKNCGGSWEIRNPSDWEKIHNDATAHCGWCGEDFQNLS